jgi:DNA repair protein RecN (Recombination protein N)
MLESLRVKNVALIRELEVEFEAGLNILSGETGAGKSMVIDAIIFLLGERPGKDFIRNGEDAALVEGMLRIRDPKNAETIRELGVDIADDGMLLVSRGLSVAGKSVCRLNGRPATVGMLREIAALLLDVHGQHEH